MAAFQASKVRWLDLVRGKLPIKSSFIETPDSNLKYQKFRNHQPQLLT